MKNLYCARINQRGSCGFNDWEYIAALSIWLRFETREDDYRTYLIYENTHATIGMSGRKVFASSMNKLKEIITIKTEIPNEWFMVYSKEEIITKFLEDNYMKDIKGIIVEEIRNYANIH
jgi:hypothetical protein